MTQLFASSNASAHAVPSEKRGNFSGLSLASKKHTNDSSNSHFPARIKNFFRINSSGSNGSHGSSHSGSDRERDNREGSHSNALKPESKSSFRQSRFLPTIGRSRSTTVASEGNPLEECLSPTAHANPYFAHQGQPALRHRNEDSPPNTLELQVEGVSADQATTASKEELARKLRRVASAPNAQGLFSGDGSEDRPKTAELGKEPLVEHQGDNPKVSLVDQSRDNEQNLSVPKVGPDSTIPSPGQIRNSASFRRTYSSNSIKVRNVEVGPGSFDKIRLIGKGDVGKVYLVREKKSGRLYAMKGECCPAAVFTYMGGCVQLTETNSAQQEGNDQAE